MKIKLLVKTNSKKYPIVIGKNLLNNIQNTLNKSNIKFNKCLIVVDKNVPKKNLLVLKKKIKCKEIIIFIFNSSEKNKNQTNVNKIIEKLFKNNFKRNDIVISFGGGITGDVSGYAASIFKRGIKFVNIPTTLLSQVDSSIGGKTGINNNYGKNLIGSFYQPDCVISDINLLKSLPKREIICGYGEILKHSIIADKKQFNFLSKNKSKILNLKSPYIEKAILDSCKTKKRIIELDENENNLRKVLNLGHTFAHAYEASQGYSKKLNHGEAVILGIKTAAKFSLEKKMLPINSYEKINSHINSINLNHKFKNIVIKKNIKNILGFMKLDKKNISKKINLILLRDIGKPVVNMKFNIKNIEKFFLKNY